MSSLATSNSTIIAFIKQNQDLFLDGIDKELIVMLGGENG